MFSTEQGAGLTEKGRQSINRRTGSNLKAPAPHAKLGTKDAARRKSFCARSRGGQVSVARQLVGGGIANAYGRTSLVPTSKSNG